MPRTTLAAARRIALAVVLGGCVVSQDSVIAAADASFDPRLVGTWEEVGGDDRAIVTRGAGGDYAIEYTADGAPGRFGARLGRLGARTILDVWPEPRPGELTPPYEAMLLPAHLPMVIELGTDSLRLWFLSPAAIRAEVRSHPERWRSDDLRDRVVLRGTTAELRAALGPHLARTDALEESTLFRRVRAARQ